jgi:hypothetical protein
VFAVVEDAADVRDGDDGRFEAPAQLDDIEVGPVIFTALPVSEVIGGASIEVTVTDAANDGPLPSRITLTRPDGTLQPLIAAPVGEVAARVGVVYTRNGRATLSVPPGDYLLHAGRGFEWGVEKVAVSLRAGETRPVALKLRA